MNRIISIAMSAVLIVLLCGASFAGDFTSTEQEFSKGTFMIDLPPGYTDLQKKSQKKVELFGFSTPPRADGTRGVILITILDLSQDAAMREMDIGEFLMGMLGGVKARRTTWAQGKTVRMILNDVNVARVQWEGNAPVEGEVLHMKGIMYAGISGDVAFVLHAQDVDAHYAEALPLCDRAMKTFQLKLKK